MKRLLLFLPFFFSAVHAQINCPPIYVGSVDNSVYVKIIDSTDGTPEQSVTSATGGLNFWYAHGEHEAHIDFASEGDLAAETSAHSDEDFIHIDDGIYRVDLPDDCCDSGAEQVLYGGEVTDMIVIGGLCALTAYDPYDAGLNLNLDQNNYQAVVWGFVTADKVEWGAEWYTNGLLEGSVTSPTIWVYEVTDANNDFEGSSSSRTALAEAGSTDQFFLQSSAALNASTLYGIEVQAIIDGTTRTDKGFAALVGGMVIVSQIGSGSDAGPIAPIGPFGPIGPVR